jgi:drug/metabolite transporter (DMT)-like permease
MSDAVIGLLLTCGVGLLWSFVGVFYKLMANWKLNPYNVNIITVFTGIVMNLIFVTKTGDFITGKMDFPTWGYVFFVMIAGFVNAGGSYILQRSMVYGNSGVTWAIGQSALIIPFLSITIIYSEPWNLFKLAGTGAIVLGMITIAARNLQKGQTADAPKPRYGIQLALTSFVVLGIAQSMTSATSFMTYTDPGLCRPLLIGIGSLFAAIAGKIYLKDKGFYFPKKLYPVVILLAAQGVIVAVMQFFALDYLKACGMNGIFFPIAIGLCIAGYSVWSVLFFKEKSSRLFFAGVAMILTGIACYCITTKL